MIIAFLNHRFVWYLYNTLLSSSVDDNSVTSDMYRLSHSWRASLVVWGSVTLKLLCLSRPVSESGQSDMLISLIVSVFRSITSVVRYTRYQSAFEWCNHLSIFIYWSDLETTQLESLKDTWLVNKYYSSTQIIEARRVRESGPTTF